MRCSVAHLTSLFPLSVISYTGFLLYCVENPVVSDCPFSHIMAAFHYKPDFRKKGVTVVQLFPRLLELVTRIIEFPLVSG